MATFALVHGAWHGAWCWERLTPELSSRGHRVVVMDLPSDDGSATFDDYANHVCAALGDSPGDDLILVGHSLAGNTIPLVAARRPVRRLVYLCALLPNPGESLARQLGEDAQMLHPDYSKGLSEKDAQGRRGWADRSSASLHLFGDCDRETADAAIDRLRLQATHPYTQPCSLTSFPDVASTYVLCTEDQLVNPGWSRRVVPERLRADIVELPGSHSPFLSRPADLAAVLDRIARL